jgi:hypothetical protein
MKEENVENSYINNIFFSLLISKNERKLFSLTITSSPSPSNPHPHSYIFTLTLIFFYSTFSFRCFPFTYFFIRYFASICTFYIFLLIIYIISIMTFYVFLLFFDIFLFDIFFSMFSVNPINIAFRGDVMVCFLIEKSIRKSTNRCLMHYVWRPRGILKGQRWKMLFYDRKRDGLSRCTIIFE